MPLSELPEVLRNLATGGELLIVDKANVRARCTGASGWTTSASAARPPDGELAGEARLLGLFTTKAYPEAASETPVLHRKLRRVLEAEDLIEGSHDHRAAVALFDAFPKDELFAAPVDDLRRAVVALLALEGTDRVRLLGRRAADGRSASLILALPRERYRALLVGARRKLFKRRFHAHDVEAQHMLGESARARVHFLVHSPALPEFENAELEREVVQSRARGTTCCATRSPSARRRPRAAAGSIWGGTLPEYYKGYTAPQTGAMDIALLEQLAETGPFLVRCSSSRATPASRSTSAARRSSWARCCRCSRTSGCG